jgi:hypothetical protein
MGPAQPALVFRRDNERKQVEFPRSSEKGRQIMMLLVPISKLTGQGTRLEGIALLEIIDGDRVLPQYLSHWTDTKPDWRVQ